MTHEEARERLHELGGLRPADGSGAALAAHVAGCAECRDALASADTIERVLRRHAAVGPPEDLAARVTSIPYRDAPAPSRRPRYRQLAWAAAVAVAVAALALAVVLRGGDPQAAFAPGRSVALRAAVPGLHARLEVGAPEGPNQPLRLVAEGLSPSAAPYYTLWLSGPQGTVSAGTFRPDADGECAVVGVVPRGVAWTSVTVTRRDLPPGPASAVARGDL